MAKKPAPGGEVRPPVEETTGTPITPENRGADVAVTAPETTAQRLGQELKSYRERIQRGEIAEDNFEYLSLKAAEEILLQGEKGRPIVEVPTILQNEDHTIVAHAERVVSSGERLTAEARAAIEARFAEKFLELSQLLKKKTLTSTEERRVEKLSRIAQGYDQYRKRLQNEDVGDNTASTEDKPDDALVADTLALIAEPPTPTEELARRPLRTALETGLDRAASVDGMVPTSLEKTTEKDPLAEQREVIRKRFEKPGSLSAEEAKGLTDEELRLVMTVKEEQRAQLDPEEAKLTKEGLPSVVDTSEDWAIAAREYRERLHTKSVPAWSTADEREEREHWQGKGGRVGARKKHTYTGVPEGTVTGEEERVTALLEHFKDDGSVYAKEDARGLSDADIKTLLKFKDKERQAVDPDALVATDPKFRHMADGNIRDYLILLEEYKKRHHIPKPKLTPVPVPPKPVPVPPDPIPTPPEPVPKPPEPVPTPPEPVPVKPGPRKVGIVDINAKIDEIARHKAEERLQAGLRGETGEKKDPGAPKAPWWKRMGQKIAGMARKSILHTGEEYYRQKYIAEETKRIHTLLQAEHPNAFAPDGTIDEFSAESRAIVERFVSQFEGVVRTEEGEKKVSLGAGAEKDALRDLVVKFANKEIDEKTFQGERARIFAEIQTAHPEIFSSEQATVDNLMDIAREFRVAAEHGQKIAAIDVQLDIELGQARSAIKDEAHLRSFDKMVKFMQKTPVLRNMANPVMLGLAVSVATGPARTLLSKAGAWAHVAGPITAAVVAGGYAGVRKNMEMKGDLAHTRRGQAMGYEIPTGARRLEKMAEFNYDQKNARDLTGHISTALSQVRRLKPGDPKYQEALEGLMETIAETDARIEHSDLSKHDFIKYSGATKIEQERFALLRTLAEAKVEFGKVSGTPGSTVSTATLEGSKARIIDVLETNVTEQDKAFGRYKRNEVIKATAVGVGTGLVVGSLFQFGTRKLQEAITHQHGPQSAIEKLWDVMHGKQEMVQTHEHSYSIGNHGRIVVPEKWHAIDTPGKARSITLFDEHNRAHVLDVMPNDHFKPNQLAALHKAGVYFAERDVPDVAHGHVTQSSEEFVKHYRGVTHIARGGGPEHAGPHFDNDTPRPFDKNELRLDMGGVHNSGITTDGKYEFDVNRMTPEGSYKGAEHVNIKELIASGHAKVLLSLSHETQKTVFELPIGPDGKVQIDPNSDIGKLFFRNVDGHAQFLGRFAEVARTVQNPDGSLMIDAAGDQHVQVLATYEGKGIQNVIGTPNNPLRHITAFQQPRDWEGPWVMPSVKRNPLEGFKQNKRETVPPYYSYSSESQRKEFVLRLSETLKNNPDAILDEHAEVEKYLDHLDPAYRADLEALDASIADPMEKETRMVIMIPAYQEAKIIQKSLEQYADQVGVDGKPLDPKTFEIIVFVNRPNDVADDGTMAEIVAFRTKHPELRVRAVEKTFPRDQVSIGRFRKMTGDLALTRSAKRKERVPGRLVLVSNDADVDRLGATYVDRLIHDFDEDRRLDAATTKLDFAEGDVYEKYPLFLATQRLMTYLDAGLRRAGYRGRPRTLGNSTAVSGEMYAAIGGYINEATLAEDLQIGEMIDQARQGNSRGSTQYENRAEVVVNPRRHIAKMKEGVPLVAMYDDWAQNETIRNKNWQTMVEGGSEKISIPRLEQEFSLMYEWMTREVGGRETKPLRELFDRAMRFVGIKYELYDVTEQNAEGQPVVKKKVKITDTSAFDKSFAEYPERHRKVTAAKERRHPRKKRTVKTDAPVEPTAAATASVEAPVQAAEEKKDASVAVEVAPDHDAIIERLLEEGLTRESLPEDDEALRDMAAHFDRLDTTAATAAEASTVETSPATTAPEASSEVGTETIPVVPETEPATTIDEPTVATTTEPKSPEPKADAATELETEAPAAEAVAEVKEVPIDPIKLRAALLEQGIPDQWLPHDDRSLVNGYRAIQHEAIPGDYPSLRQAIRDHYGVPTILLRGIKNDELLKRFAAVEKAVSGEGK